MPFGGPAPRSCASVVGSTEGKSRGPTTRCARPRLSGPLARWLPRRGFTLIEVLAALVIVSLGMLGVIQAVTQTVSNGAYLREKTLAHWIAMNVITERPPQSEPPPIGETSDDLDFAGRRWRWTLKVTQTQVASLRRMDVSVRPAEKPDGTPRSRR